MAGRSIRTPSELRELMAAPGDVVLRKVIDHVDGLAARFLEMCPFVVVASADADGHMDLSPKGDPPGFVQVLGPRTLAIPERPGNHRADTFLNVLANPHVGLICLVPGMDETLRIAGRGVLSTDPELLASMEVRGHRPVIALVITVEELFIHCGKAPKRARLWNPDARIARGTYPSMGEVMHAHGRLDDVEVTREQMHERALHDYLENVY